jgi:chromosome segregation ATPase
MSALDDFMKKVEEEETRLGRKLTIFPEGFDFPAQIAALQSALASRNAELEKLRTESAERARVDMERIEDLETQLHARKFDVFNLENRSEDLERQLSEARATVELLYSENARLQRQVDETDARNLALLKERGEIREELDTEEEAAAFMHTRIGELLGVKHSLEKRIAELEATKAVER